MHIEEVEAIISKDGSVTLKVRGAPGRSCLAITRDLEAALGGQVAERQFTAEYEPPAPQQAELADKPPMTQKVRR